MSWGHGAPCTQMDPELWFPVGEVGRGARIRDLVRVCEGCDVRAQCARTALAIGAAHGVWAGIDLGDGDVSKGRRRAREHLTAIANAAEEVEPEDEPTRTCGSCGQEFRTTQLRGTCWSCSRVGA